jgi:hypothetical protein
MKKTIKVMASIKYLNGGCQVLNLKFKDEKAYNDWFDKHNRDHRNGKIIGVIKT